ncbi:hypothetical protein CVT26_014608 [Gymnopilus dilepis]|uniref:Uncharacterized protein n=1 Tax=Gymnopilus dilepis TaxID=231916 RepID=A0A409WS91_9AGAR|nr:hypothetical protein CVT26_014608 [Gymnopilus dilepis]
MGGPTGVDKGVHAGERVFVPTLPWRCLCPLAVQKRDGGGSFPLPLRQPQPHLPRVEERVGGGLTRLHNPDQRRHHLPTPSSLEKTSRRRGGEPNSAHRRSLAGSEPHFLRIKQRVGGGGSAFWCPAGVVAAAVAAAPTLSACHPKLREWVACWAALCPAPPCFWFVRQDKLGSWLALLHPPTLDIDPPLRHPRAMCEFRLDTCGVADALTPHVPRLHDRVGRWRLASVLSRSNPRPFPPLHVNMDLRCWSTTVKSLQITYIQ